MNNRDKLEFGKLQIEEFKAYALLDHARIVSGAYKLAKTEVGVEGGGWRPCTEEEKLQNAMGILERRCQWISDAVEHQAKLMELIEKEVE